MIRNLDGTPFTLNGSIQQFDPNNPDIDLLNRLDAEAIQISGSPVYYHEVLIQFQSIDRLYLEDRSKLFNPNGIQLFAFYEPPEQSNMSGLFSIDTPDEEILMEFNYQAVLQTLGHPPKVGSRIYTPHRGEHWLVLDRRLTQFKAWSAFHLVLLCKKYQANRTSGEAEIDPPVDFRMGN